MNSLFASHKGRLFKKLLMVAVAAAFAMMIFGGGTGPTGDSSAASKKVSEANAGPQVGHVKVYAQSTAEPTATPTPSTSGNDEAIITNDVKVLARDFVVQWTTYDYQQPPAYTALKGAAKDPDNNGTLVSKHSEWTNGMKSRKELSTGSVGSVNITGLNYKGNAQSGAGEGTVKVTVNQTISNSEVGSAGTTVVRAYEVKVRKIQGGTDDGNSWFVYDIVALS